ncbi:MAG: hypothetical protein U0525_01820 [Patescibacteria group bacterium]
MESEHDQTLLAWKAPLRPFKKRSPVVMRFFLAIALLLTAIVFFFGDMVTVLPIWAVLFLFYIFAITPPPIIENRITKFGVETSAGFMVRWDALSHYYFQERFGYTVCVLVTHGPYYAHTYIVVPDEQTKATLAGILSQHLMFVTKPPVTLTDKLIGIFSKIVPEESQREEGQAATA